MTDAKRDLTESELDDLLLTTADAEEEEKEPTASEVYRLMDLVESVIEQRQEQHRKRTWVYAAAAGILLVSASGWWLNGQFNKLHQQTVQLEQRVGETQSDLQRKLATDKLRRARFETEVLESQVEVWNRLEGTEAQLKGRLKKTAVQLARSQRRLESILQDQRESTTVRLGLEEARRRELENRLADSQNQLSKQKQSIESLQQVDKKQTKVLERFQLWGDQTTEGTAHNGPDAGQQGDPRL